MSPETGRKIVDLLFKMYDEDDKLKPINKSDILENIIKNKL